MDGKRLLVMYPPPRSSLQSCSSHCNVGPDEVWPWPRYDLSLSPRGCMNPLTRLSAWSWRKQALAVSPQLKMHFGNTVRSAPYLLCASVYLPVSAGVYLLPWGMMKGKEHRDHALATFKPLLSLLSDEHLCLLFSPWALHILLATTFTLRFLCQLKMKREVAMASA